MRFAIAREGETQRTFESLGLVTLIGEAAGQRGEQEILLQGEHTIGDSARLVSLREFFDLLGIVN